MGQIRSEGMMAMAAENPRAHAKIVDVSPPRVARGPVVVLGDEAVVPVSTPGGPLAIAARVYQGPDRLVRVWRPGQHPSPEGRFVGLPPAAVALEILTRFGIEGTPEALDVIAEAVTAAIEVGRVYGARRRPWAADYAEVE